jgi:putative YhbY family RNA-binding protein
MVGKEGLSESVIKAMYNALRSHELIKIRLPAEDQTEFKALVHEVLEACEGSEKVQTIGHLLVLFRPSVPPGKISKKLQEAKIPYSKKDNPQSDEEE